MKLLKTIFTTSLLIPALALANVSPEQKGLEIAAEGDRRDTGFGDTTSSLVMELKNRNGDISVRQLRTLTLEVINDGDKIMSVFDKPTDVKGTSMLTFSHKQGNDDQWLYLPALKRVKRINSSNKSGPFMGSEFAYEDISSQEVEKYSYRWLRDEQLNGQDCFVIERYPLDKKSGYNRQMVWIDKAEYRMQKVDFYDRKDSLLKTLLVSGYQQYLGKFWRAEEMEMTNHQNGKSSRLVSSNYQFQTGLNERDFNKNSLKRVR
ncbi:MAG: outer membrane lipoprotein-sorting protein [Gammaproteobacteria bacterium]|nr:outer membrane lipoprotein-sorting protein [Gammaproteobacteria bacterium]